MDELGFDVGDVVYVGWATEPMGNAGYAGTPTSVAGSRMPFMRWNMMATKV